MKTAVCPGSFDPITFGHIDVIQRAAQIFDRVVVAVATNLAKNYFFSDEERLQLAAQSLAHLPNVEIYLAPSLLVDFAKAHQADAIVKGLRGGADFFNEEPMALLNRNLTEIETVFVLADPALAHVASSYVKEVAAYHGSIDKLVPEHVAAAVYNKLAVK